MESAISSICVFVLFCIVPLGVGLIVVLGIRGLPLSKRGIQSMVQMDGANFLKTDEGNIKIKRRTFYIWFIVMVLGAFELGLIAVAIPGLTDIVNNKDVSTIIIFGVGIFFIGYVLFRSIQSLRKPSIIQIDTNSRIITIGSGLTEEQIPFSQVIEIFSISPPTPRFGLLRVERIDIRIMLDNGKVVEMGSVSGEKYNAQSRAVAIAQQIAEVTGAKIRGSLAS